MPKVFETLVIHFFFFFLVLQSVKSKRGQVKNCHGKIFFVFFIRIPLVWAARIISLARKECKIRDDVAVKTILDEINAIRKKCGILLSYDTISIPIVYTQTVTIAVYSYFLITLIGHQWIETKNKLDSGIPFFAILQFFFYMGLLRVSEILINPFGEDDDDFEINWMVDRNIQVGLLIVDDMHNEYPELIKDKYWSSVVPQQLPHTAESQIFSFEYPVPSTNKIAVSNRDISSPGSIRMGLKSYSDRVTFLIFYRKTDKQFFSKSFHIKKR